MATLYCPCGQAHELWGEFWWTEGHYQWIFFDYEKRSETYSEQVENCPACGLRRLYHILMGAPELEKAKPRFVAGGAQEGTRRPCRRIFGGEG